MKPNRFANAVPGKSAEASPLEARGGLGRGVEMTEQSVVRAGCHALGTLLGAPPVAQFPEGNASQDFGTMQQPA